MVLKDVDSVLLAALILLIMACVIYRLLYYYSGDEKIPNTLEDLGKIVVISLSTSDIEHWAKYPRSIIQDYCKKQGYPYIVYNKILDPSMHVNWSRLLAVKDYWETHPDFQYLLLMDVDVWIIDSDFRFESIIKHYEDSSTHLIMAGDCFSRFFCPAAYRKRPNAGVVFFKKSPIAKEILDVWLHKARNECSGLADKHPRNQNVLWECILPLYKKYIKVIPPEVMNSGFGNFIRHYMIHSRCNTEEFFKKMYEKQDREKVDRRQETN